MIRVMSIRMKNSIALLAPVAIIFGLALTRLVPHIPNFAPITAMALFGGAYLGRRWAFIVPLSAMALSDYLLLYVHPFSPQIFDFSHVYPLTAALHGASWAVYLSFIISGAIGLWLQQHKSAGAIAGATLFASLQFFFITNAAVWMGGMYDPSILGLFESYVAGLPFLRGTLLGDFFYTGALFGGYELAKRWASERRSRLAYARVPAEHSAMTA